MTAFAPAVAEAAAALRALFEPTPLLRNDALSERHGADIWLKREDLSPVRSYKLRGAFNAMRKLPDPSSAHVVCASAGNHAQGVAYACRHFGAKGTIFMPVTTPRQKIDRTRLFGGGTIRTELTGDTFDAALAAAQAFCEAEGAVFLSPFDDPDIIEGQATVAHEVLEALDAPPDLMVLPVGGGGLAAGTVRLLDERSPATGVALAEPAGAASLRAALSAGHLVTLPRMDNFVDGAAVARIGELPFRTLARFRAEDVLVAPEDRISATILAMLNTEGLVLEPAGALTLDVLPDLFAARPGLAGKRIVCVISGGNFDFERLPEVRERAARHAGVKRYFILRLPQRPGALREFLDLLGPHDDIARFEYLKKSARNFGSVLIGIETAMPEELTALVARMEDAGLDFRDITGDVVLSEFLV